MCGIAGFLESQRSHSQDPSSVLKNMGKAINHRGPDDSDVWLNKSSKVGFAHQRLSIVDLTPAGHQPMRSHSGRYTLVYNGEIFNHLKLRSALEKKGQAPVWKGHSDTETLLAGIESWGLAKTLQKCIGMFALALWDEQLQSLSLARDRMGEKPLYYGWQENTFLFGSELKALKAHPAFKSEIDRDALCLFMRHSYIPAPDSIYQGINKLMPGCLLTLPFESRQYQGKPHIESYWSVADTAQQCAHPFEGNREEATIQLESLLMDAVGQQMMADVPLGAFLSGGVDSSLVVALMQAQSSRPIQTFTIGFHDERYNEAHYAKDVAHHLGTEHSELYVTPEDSMEVIPKLPHLFDEPFADPSQIPTFLVSQLAQQDVKVALSGDGGDELFAGYHRYQFTANTWNKLAHFPQPARQFIAKNITRISPAGWNKVLNILPSFGHLSVTGDRLHKGAGVMSSTSIEGLSLGVASLWQAPSDVVINATEPATFYTGNLLNMDGLNNIERMMLLDLLVYLPDDILCKVDRAAMGVSLETRAPLLDHRVVEFAWQLPMEYKIHGDDSKWILRQILQKHVPRTLIDRPKMGFCVPIDQWLRGPLRDWAEDLLDETRLQQDGYFKPAPIRKRWKEHLSGNNNWQLSLWNVLMFNTWIREGNIS